VIEAPLINTCRVRKHFIGTPSVPEIEIEVEIAYNMYRMNRLLPLGPPNNAIHETYKSGLDSYAPKSNLSKGCSGGFTPPPGEGVVHGGGCVHLGACVGAVCGVAASGCAGFYAVHEKEMMQSLDSVRMELCDDA
jgi:hypothetical protein